MRAGNGCAPKSSSAHHSPDPLAASPRHPTGVLAVLSEILSVYLTLWSGVAAPPRALCELHSGPHVKKIVLRLRSKKAEISKRLWPRNRKNGKRIYSYYGLQTRYAVWRSRSHYCVVSLKAGYQIWPPTGAKGPFRPHMYRQTSLGRQFVI